MTDVCAFSFDPPLTRDVGIVYRSGEQSPAAAAFIATEVFDDMVALERQEALPQVQEALAVLGESLASEPEATVFHVSSSAPWGS